jgi:polysaccharide export outer membrane protein
MNNPRAAFLAISFLWLHIQIFAAETNVTALPATAMTMESLDARQKLSPGDRITYRVIEDHDPPTSLTITDSGDVEVPYYGLVRAADRTCRDLASHTKTLLEKRLYYQATVIIAIESVNRTLVIGRVFVTGQVQQPGGYDILSGEHMTVSKAILSAGGFSDFSDKKHVRLARKTSAGDENYIINVRKIWEDGELNEDIEVQPDDLIVVPARLVNY